MQDMYPFTYFDLYIYINIICHKFQEVPRGCANHFFSNNFTLSFLKYPSVGKVGLDEGCNLFK